MARARVTRNEQGTTDDRTEYRPTIWVCATMYVDDTTTTSVRIITVFRWLSVHLASALRSQCWASLHVGVNRYGRGGERELSRPTSDHVSWSDPISSLINPQKMQSLQLLRIIPVSNYRRYRKFHTLKERPYSIETSFGRHGSVP